MPGFLLYPSAPAFRGVRQPRRLNRSKDARSDIPTRIFAPSTPKPVGGSPNLHGRPVRRTASSSPNPPLPNRRGLSDYSRSHICPFTKSPTNSSTRFEPVAERNTPSEMPQSHACIPRQFVIFRHLPIVLVSFLLSFALVPSPNLRISPVLLRPKADRISPLLA